MAYVLILYTTYYDFDTHYEEDILGVFSSEELAEKAKERFDKEFKYDMRPRCDEWETEIVEYELDELDPKELPYIGGEDE